MNPEEVVSLFHYDRWATDAQLIALDQLTQEQYTKDLASSHGGLRGTLVHIYAAQWIWLKRWKGESPTALVAASEIPTLNMLRERWTVLRNEMNEFATALTQEKLKAPLTYKDTKGAAYSQPLSDQIRHVINHSTYHRGQITTMLRQLGVMPPASIDLISYYRQL
jgi:uncharacterized damage-inducible protein DinB